MALDLASFSSIKRFAVELVAKYPSGMCIWLLFTFL
jgi:hypothetical protein